MLHECTKLEGGYHNSSLWALRKSIEKKMPKKQTGTKYTLLQTADDFVTFSILCKKKQTCS